MGGWVGGRYTAHRILMALTMLIPKLWTRNRISMLLFRQMWWNKTHGIKKSSNVRTCLIYIEFVSIFFTSFRSLPLPLSHFVGTIFVCLFLHFMQNLFIPITYVYCGLKGLSFARKANTNTRVEVARVLLLLCPTSNDKIYSIAFFNPA